MLRLEDVDLFSSIGKEEYVCTGSCLCDSSERRNVGVLRSGMFKMLAAVSGVIAVHKAREYFSKECKETFYETCPVDKIKSEVTKCSKTAEADCSDDVDKTIKRLPLEKAEMVVNPKNFYCRGGCKDSKGKNGGEHHIICEDIKVIERKFVFDCPDVTQKKNCKRGKCGLVKKDFRNRWLDDHCEKASTVFNFNDDGTKETFCIPDKRSIKCRRYLDGLPDEI